MGLRIWKGATSRRTVSSKPPSYTAKILDFRGDVPDSAKAASRGVTNCDSVTPFVTVARSPDTPYLADD